MKVVSREPIKFKCCGCGSINEGEPNEFYRVPNTMPPQFQATCADCRSINTVYPRQLIAAIANVDAVNLLRRLI